MPRERNPLGEFAWPVPHLDNCWILNNCYAILNEPLVEFTAATNDDSKRQVVQEFVGEHDSRTARLVQVPGVFGSVSEQGTSLFKLLLGAFHQLVVQRAQTIWSARENCGSKGSFPCSHLDHAKLVRLSKVPPTLV